jgi:hypothetical protein
MLGKEETVEASADMSNLREVQGTVALITVGGFMAVAAHNYVRELP